jgi:sec-independent protein translocase protein TatC
MSEKTMSVVDHLTELRTRIVVVLIGFVVTFVAGLFLAKPVILFLQHAEQAKNIDMNAFRVTDPLDVYMKFAFIIGIVLCSPVIMYQIWAFIRPGLLEHEQKVTLSYIPMTFFLFIFGLMFSYFIIFPNILGFMQDLGQSLNIDNVIGINEYFSFLIQMTLPFGFLFQMPILVMFLTRLGLITPYFLVKVRKYAYFILIVIAGIITPPELVSHLMVTVPLIILYEISIGISKFSYRRSILRVNHEE